MTQNMKPTFALWTSAIAALAVAACSAGGDTSDDHDSTPVPEDETNESGGSTANPTPTHPSGGMGGAGEDIAHPLLGAGNYTASEFSDPCDLAQFWELDVLLDLSTGALVQLEETVYEVTGPGSDHGYTMTSIAPPCIEQWCIDQYGYEVVKTCPE